MELCFSGQALQLAEPLYNVQAAELKRQTLKGRWLLLTGASGGIGLAIARKLAEQGVNIILQGYKQIGLLDELCEELRKLYPKQKFLPIRVNLFSAEGLDQIISFIRAHAIHPSLFIHGAGTAQIGLINDLQTEDYQKLQRLHLEVPLFLCQKLFPYFLEAHWGRVVLISSIWGLCGASCEVAYSAVKAGMIGLTKALAKEWGPSGITVNCVAPGVIDTPMNYDLDSEARALLLEEIPVGRFGTGQDVAEAVSFFCQIESSYTTGQIISPNGGMIT